MQGCMLLLHLRPHSLALPRCAFRAFTVSASPGLVSAVLPNAKIVPCKDGVYEEYIHAVNTGKLQFDEHQFSVIQTLEKVQQGIHKKSSSITSVHLEKSTEGNMPLVMIPRGLYIFGEVGTGKTMMMDMFLKSTNVPKVRVHFHKFMLSVHKIIHEFKQDLLRKYGRQKNLDMDSGKDPILHCASVIRQSGQLLCFDEFQVTDIADAIIMTKLFGELWRQGITLVATSNRPPTGLYQGGLNRSYFLPFIAELEHRCLVRQLKSPIDYRTLLSTKLPNAYLTPVNDETTARLHAMFLADPSSTSLVASVAPVPVMMGREIKVLARDRVCFVTFEDMCDNNRGAADYSALAAHMDVIYLCGVPPLSVLVHDKARRFITFIDEIYDAGRRLVWTAEREPQHLFQFLTPKDIKGADFGTDHSWADLETVRGESGEQMGKAVHHQVKGIAGEKAGTVVEKDGAIISMRFQEASRATEMSFQEESGVSSSGSSSLEEKEIKLLEGELASIQELSFAFKRAASRMIEMSGESYLEACRTK